MNRAGHTWIATCARGLEEILEGELRALGLPPTGTETGGVRFSGGVEAAMRANWRLRSANRVLLELASWSAEDDEALYRGAYALVDGGDDETPLSAPALLTPSRTFAILATSRRSRIRDTRWIALKVKDAIVDAQRSRFGRRASVAREAPDLPLRVRLHGDRAALLLDTSGDPLDRRGYRLESTAAPVREQLAAAMLLAADWDGRGPVVDPMCGSGTLLAEAGAIARGLAPNRLRERWSLLAIPGFEASTWARVRAEPIPAPDPDVRLIGCDLEAGAIAAARRNLVAAGLAAHARLAVGDGLALEPPPARGLVAVNPPYGDRVHGEADLWRRLGDRLKRSYRGWGAVVLAGDPALGRQLGLRPRRRIPVWNGPIEARILLIDLY